MLWPLNFFFMYEFLPFDFRFSIFDFRISIFSFQISYWESGINFIILYNVVSLFAEEQENEIRER